MIEIVTADYHNPQHAADIGYLLNCYAIDPMGGGEPLSEAIQKNLANELAKVPHAFSVLAYSDDQPAALANCFEVFSTFQCKPIVNIHDLVVVKGARGAGLGQKMLDEIENIARQKGCCKLTLEVLAGNQIARNAYTKFGFEGYELNPEVGQALFMAKPIN